MEQHPIHPKTLFVFVDKLDQTPYIAYEGPVKAFAISGIKSRVSLPFYFVLRSRLHMMLEKQQPYHQKLVGEEFRLEEMEVLVVYDSYYSTYEEELYALAQQFLAISKGKLHLVMEKNRDIPEWLCKFLSREECKELESRISKTSLGKCLWMSNDQPIKVFVEGMLPMSLNVKCMEEYAGI